MEISMEVSQKLKINLLYKPAYPTPGYLLKEPEASTSQRQLHSSYSTDHSKQVRYGTNGGIHKKNVPYNVAYTRWNFFQPLKKNQQSYVICWKMDKTEDNHSEWVKSVSERQTSDVHFTGSS